MTYRDIARKLDAEVDATVYRVEEESPHSGSGSRAT